MLIIFCTNFTEKWKCAPRSTFHLVSKCYNSCNLFTYLNLLLAFSRFHEYIKRISTNILNGLEKANLNVGCVIWVYFSHKKQFVIENKQKKMRSQLDCAWVMLKCISHLFQCPFQSIQRPKSLNTDFQLTKYPIGCMQQFITSANIGEVGWYIEPIAIRQFIDSIDLKNYHGVLFLQGDKLKWFLWDLPSNG